MLGLFLGVLASFSLRVPAPDDLSIVAKNWAEDWKYFASICNQGPVIRIDVVSIRFQLLIDRVQFDRHIVFDVGKPNAVLVQRDEFGKPFLFFRRGVHQRFIVGDCAPEIREIAVVFGNYADHDFAKVESISHQRPMV
jgi:hypothetical protein